MAVDEQWDRGATNRNLPVMRDASSDSLTSCTMVRSRR